MLRYLGCDVDFDDDDDDDVVDMFAWFIVVVLRLSM